MKKYTAITLLCLILSAVSFSLTNAQTTVPPPIPRNATVCGETIFGLTTDNNLIRFNSDVPGALIATTPITGLLAGEFLLGIDYRPALKEIYALSNQNRLYIIDSTTGFARLTGVLNTGINGTTFGIDFNPVPDRMRVVSDANQNLRINVDTGVTIVDGNLAFAATDRDAGADPNVVAVAYSNNFAGATTTTLYAIDSTLDVLAIQNPPNNGTLVTVGNLGVDTGDAVGFDIAAGSTRAFASLTPAGTTASNLYTIDLTSGAATLVGGIGNGVTIRDITVAPRAALTVFAVTVNNNLLTFDSDDPTTITGFRRIRGLKSGETILGIDFRPANGKLYALGSTGTVYIINLKNTKVTPRPIAPFSTALTGTEFGFDFNPVPDRIRVTSDADQNLRLQPDTGDVAAVDGTLAFASTDVNAARNPNIVASAYANNFAGTTTTTLYNIDSELDALLIQNPPNNGTLNTVGSLGLDTTNLAGFDIFGCDNAGFAALTLQGEAVSKFYRINLVNGSAMLIGTLGVNELIRAIAVNQ
ncbi:MAG: DUF4394 domain-containing protein [Acidobacteriota bacterium]